MQVELSAARKAVKCRAIGVWGAAEKGDVQSKVQRTMTHEMCKSRRAEQQCTPAKFSKGIQKGRPLSASLSR